MLAGIYTQTRELSVSRLVYRVHEHHLEIIGVVELYRLSRFTFAILEL